MVRVTGKRNPNWPGACTRRTKIKCVAALVAANLCFFLLCRAALVTSPAPDYALKLQAAVQADAAQQVLGARLLGEEYTPITTTLGSPAAKQLAAHPDFAAVAVEMLDRAGVRQGDTVAVNMSGSFPALNIAVLAAVHSLGAVPVITSSVGASTWGANRPDFTWPDMEAQLVRAGIWSYRSAGVSLGGGADNGGGLLPEGISLARQAAQRSGSLFLDSQSVDDAIAKRLALYKAANHGALPAALINVGGNHVIFGAPGHAAFLRQGLTVGYRPSLAKNHGLAAAFVNAQRPVLHFLDIERLAAAYGIREQTPVGRSRVYYTQTVPLPVRVLIVIWLAGMVLVLYRGQTKGWWRWAN